MFALERRAMDRPGHVVSALERRLPAEGLILDVGAGDGFTAQRLVHDRRRVIALEPAAGMVRPERALSWVRGEAEHLPFSDAAVDAAYATWAYFFTGGGWDPGPGLRELHRVVRPGGPLLIVDNLGDDGFLSYVKDGTGHRADLEIWNGFGFECEAIETVFAFDDLEEARTLLAFYFGESGRNDPKLEIGYRVGLFAGVSTGPTA